MSLTKLDDLTDDQLNEVFAAEVAQLQPMYHVFKRGYYYRPNAAGYTDKAEEAGLYTEAEAKVHEYPRGEQPVTIKRVPTPSFATDVNAVLPWLEKASYSPLIMRPYHHDPDMDRTYEVLFYGLEQRSSAPTFARALVLALIQAKRAHP